MFPSDDVRTRSIEAIERTMMPRSIRELAEFSLAVILLFGGPWLVVSMLVNGLLPGIAWRGWITLSLTLAIYIVLVYALLRRDVRRDLRRALLDCGVPICLRCGYDLRGLPDDVAHCPECGTPPRTPSGSSTTDDHAALRSTSGVDGDGDDAAGAEDAFPGSGHLGDADARQVNDLA